MGPATNCAAIDQFGADIIRSERGLAGALLVLILVLLPPFFFAGMLRLPRDVWTMPLERKQLRMIAEHPSAWRVANTWFLIALVLSSLGLAVLARELRGTEMAHVAELALVAYVMGAILWMIDIVFRLTAMMGAADETVRTGAAPVWAGPIAHWGFGLLVLYATLANVAVLGLGAALLWTDLVAAWAAWAAVAMSVIQLALLVITRDSVPLLNFIGPIVIGIALLLPGS